LFNKFDEALKIQFTSRNMFTSILEIKEMFMQKAMPIICAMTVQSKASHLTKK